MVAVGVVVVVAVAVVVVVAVAAVVVVGVGAAVAMKVLLLGDLQLEGGQSLGHGEYGPGSRFHDQEMMLGQIADIAEAEGVQLAILAGDTFDRPKPSPWAILALQGFLSRLPQALILAGNHDMKSLELPSVLECLHDKEKNHTFVGRPWAFDWAPLRVSVLPWMPPGFFTNELDDAPGDRDEMNARAATWLASSIYPPIDGKRNILVGHWAISGGTTSAGVGVEVFREPVIPCEALASAGFDMVAFGHIHHVQVLHPDPPVLYLGSPWVGSFGEVGSPHGVWIYDTKQPEMRFVPVKDRPFYTWEAEVAVNGHLVVQAGDSLPLKDAVIRIRYEATEEQARGIDNAAYRDDLLKQGASKVIVQPNIIKTSRARVTESVRDDLTPDRAVQAYLDTTDGSPVDVERALELHSEFTGRLS